SSRRRASAAKAALTPTASLLAQAERELGDQLAVQLARTLARLERLRLEEQAPDLVLRREPIAAVHLHRLERVSRRRLPRDELRHRRPQPPRLAPRALPPPGPVDDGPRGLRAADHVGDLRLDHLELADLLAEGLALARVRDGELEAALRLADAARRHRVAPHVEGAAEHREAA